MRNLIAQGYQFEDPGLRGIGYQEWKDYLEGNCSLEEVKANIQKHSRQYAKRQYTWLNHQMEVHWFDALDNNAREAMKKEIKAWYEKN